MPYTPIIGTLAYVFDHANSSVLMVHRNRRANDEHLGKWNGLGGKLETHEDLAAGVRRELREEAGIEVIEMRLRGTVSWPGFGPNGEDWLSPIFIVDAWSGTPTNENDEGRLVWIPLERVLRACDPNPDTRAAADLPMWEGDRHFVPLVFDDDPRQFHGVMPYSSGRPTGWTVERW
ncbi:MAG: NUDIX hydrolase [Actinomycetota bacterium]